MFQMMIMIKKETACTLVSFANHSINTTHNVLSVKDYYVADVPLAILVSDGWAVCICVWGH